MTLLSNFESNPKTAKLLDELGYEGVILHLASASSAAEAVGRDITVCPLAEKNKCIKDCLDHAGMGKFANVQAARIKKTALYFDDRPLFMEILKRELGNLIVRSNGKGKKPVARLDGTSDLGLAMKTHSEFPEILHYDYTKVFPRYMRWLRSKPSNYHLTFSLGAGNKDEALEVLKSGGNVAVVFRAKPLRKGTKPNIDHALPAEWEGYDVLDGDKHDFRFMDPIGGHVIGLRAKGTAYRDRTGFVQEVC